MRGFAAEIPLLILRRDYDYFIVILVSLSIRVKRSFGAGKEISIVISGGHHDKDPRLSFWPAGQSLLLPGLRLSGCGQPLRLDCANNYLTMVRCTAR